MASVQDFTQAPTKPFSIAVVGGGIAGAALTLNLLSHGVPVTIYEAAHKFGEIGAGVSFGPNASRAMELISPHVYEAFENVATHNQWDEKKDFWFEFRYGEADNGTRKEGESISQLPCKGGQASVHRAHFLDGMVKFLPEGVARFGKRAIGYEDLGEGKGVIIKFDDGTEATHDAVVGCDGIKSRIRLTLLGESHPSAKAVYSGKYCYRGLIPMDQARELLGDELAMNAQMYLGNHGHVLTFGVEKGKTMNVVAFASSKSWDNPSMVIDAKRDDMLADFSHFGSNVRSILSLMTKNTIWALFNHPPAPTYSKGRVTLIGDAAHATTPHCGAGAGMAIEDAYILGNLLGDMTDKSEIVKTFEVYDQVRRARSSGLVEHSRAQGETYEFENESVGDDPAQLGERMAKNMSWVWDYDITEELAEARRLVKGKSLL